MSRNRMVNGELVPLSAEESAAMDAADAEWESTGKIEAAWKQVREERNVKLAASDWTQGRDITLSNDDAWKSYRTALRDLPANTSDPANPTWPEEPSQ